MIKIQPRVKKFDQDLEKAIRLAITFLNIKCFLKQPAEPFNFRLIKVRCFKDESLMTILKNNLLFHARMRTIKFKAQS